MPSAKAPTWSRKRGETGPRWVEEEWDARSHLYITTLFWTVLYAQSFFLQVSCLIKYLVFGFNVFFWFIGIAICAAGFYAWIEKDTISNLSKLSKIPFDPALVLIVVGGVMFILGWPLDPDGVMLLTYPPCWIVICQCHDPMFFFLFRIYWLCRRTQRKYMSIAIFYRQRWPHSLFRIVFWRSPLYL